jgi:hypothetical protein
MKTVKTKICPSCKQDLLLEKFYFTNGARKRYSAYCKECSGKKIKEGYTYPETKKQKKQKYYYDNIERVRDTNYKKSFGIDLEEYSKKEALQDFKCKICFSKNKSGKKLAVDHDHATGKIRDLLCSSCNSALGLLKEDIDILANMIEYLKRHKNEQI